MKLRFILLLSLVVIENAWNQNLVPNPGFEAFEECPKNYTLRHRKELVTGWYMPSGGTADYFNSCTNVQVGVPQNFMGYALPKDGMAYAGLILLFDPKKNENYREYLQTKLTKLLDKDKVYQVSFYFFVATNSTFAINRLGAYLSEKNISKRSSTGVLHFKPQVEIDSTVIFKENEWQTFSAFYKARGGEQYITIGNFYSDNRTNFEELELSGHSMVKKQRIAKDKLSYYYIDLVSVIEIEKPSEN